MERPLVLIIITAMMFLLVRTVPGSFIATGAGATLCFGFLILAAYLLAGLLARLKLPKITGYILAGMLFGPSVLELLSQAVVLELRLVDDLALTFIAFAAGGELRLGMLRARQRSIVFTFLCLMVFAFAGITLSLTAMRSFFPFTMERTLWESLAVASIGGAIAVARSPSSVIAIISEVKASGPFTDTVLGVTVALDVMAIFIFAVVVSVAEVVLSAGGQLNVTFLLGIAAEVAASVIIGLGLGKGIALYLERVGKELTIFTLGVAFLTTKVAHGMAHVLDAELGLRFHLEPMLICLTAGFVVQNFSKSGQGFLKIIDRSALPIYVIFFAISGASLRLEALQQTWHWALALVALRSLFIFVGANLGGRLAGDSSTFCTASGLSFFTQAGVSIGLVKVVMDRFPDFGPAYATLLVATITLNQLIGPVGFKSALSLVGEARTVGSKIKPGGGRGEDHPY